MLVSQREIEYSDITLNKKRERKRDRDGGKKRYRERK